jgi:hypothetical protein
MPLPCGFSKRRTRGNTSSPNNFIDCILGHPDKMNWLTPARLKSINASAIVCAAHRCDRRCAGGVDLLDENSRRLRAGAA